MKVIIIGGGQVGEYIAGLLISNNCSVKLIENREAVVTKLMKTLPPDAVVWGSGTDPNILETCGISKTDVVAAVTGDDETNLVASTIAKFEFNIPRVIARVNNPKNKWLFDAGMGVDVCVNQADLMAHLVVEEMDLNNMMTLMKISHGNCSIIQVKVDSKSSSVNKAVKDLGIPPKALLIAVYRGKDVIIPNGQTVISADDEIMAFTDENAQVKINEIFGA
jgi:trk system potassium uptake protein TrkA